jgi:hypothetical protein
MSKHFFVFFNFLSVFFCSTLALVKNHSHEWNTFTSWFIEWKVLLLFFWWYFIFIYWFILLLIFLLFLLTQWKNSLNHRMMLKSNERQSHSLKMQIFVQYSLTKWLTHGLWGCSLSFIIFIFIYFILLAKCYALAQMTLVFLV